MTFFALTTVQPPRAVGRLGEHRTVGLFESYADAHDILRNNYGDLNEAGYYPYAVIEEYPYGLYPWCERRRWWYVFDVTNDCWVQLQTHWAAGQIDQRPTFVRNEWPYTHLANFAHIG